MVNKKLAALLTTAVVLGQTSLLATHFAQADSQLPLSQESTQPESLQVASVIQHTEIDSTINAVRKPSTPDVYTIGASQGKLQTIIQVLPQDDNVTSLFVNGTEILRFNGTVDDQDSYSRVKAIADKLNGILITEPDQALQIRPAMQSTEDGQKQAVIRMGDDVLATVDAETSKTAQESQPELAFLYANRLRQVLGAVRLQEKDFAFLHDSSKTADKYVSTGRVMTGMASWYGPHFHGRRAADGSRFNMNALTAAHKTLPFGTVVRVINQRNHKSCYVRITDRGPYAHGRIIDLSRGAAKAIGMLGSGVARVSVEIVRKSS
jgi:rare lipoprotein A (peptidoglycan hydrolase)